MEKISVSSKVISYTNVLEKTVQNKVSQGVCLQDVQERKRPIGNCLPAHKTRLWWSQWIPGVMIVDKLLNLVPSI